MATKTQPDLVEFTKTVKMGQFPYNVKVIVTTDVNQSIINRPKLVGEHERDPQIVAMNCPDIRGRGYSYLFIPFKISAGKIAHEAYHSIRAMLLFISEETESEELVTYHLEHLVDSAEKHRNASIKKRDKPIPSLPGEVTKGS